MRSFALGLLAFAGLSLAQDAPQNNYPYTIDPSKVSESDRDGWCENQKAQCPLICLQQPGVTDQTTLQNDCDPDALTYACVCDNGVSPNITQYSQTLPYYICTQWGNVCVDNCNGDNTCQNACRADHPCGAQHPNPPNSSLLTTMSSTTATPAATSGPAQVTDQWGTVVTTAPAKGDNKGAAPAMLDLGQSYGLAVVAAGVFAGFALIL